MKTFLFLCVFLTVVVSSEWKVVKNSTSTKKQQPNLIFMVADGWGNSHVTMTRFVKQALGLGPLFHDTIFHGNQVTTAADSLVTDSAASATAWACGIRTNNRYVGTDVLGRPCPTTMEAVIALKGFKTGLVATSRITDATPAAFVGHVTERGEEETLALQQIYAGVDVILGGGQDKYRIREDGRDLFEEAGTILGYNLVVNREGMLATNELPLLGLFTLEHMSLEVDRNETEEPSLTEMTQKAIDLLSNAAQADDTSFFLHVEGSQVDKAEHDLDPVGSLFDAIEYDKAVEYAVEWARNEGNTLVISTADHECGGISLLGGSTWYPERFAFTHASIRRMIERIEAGESADTVIRSSMDFTDITPEEITNVINQEPSLFQALSAIYSTRLNIGWGTEQGDHTGEDVKVWADGVGCENIPRQIDINDLGLWMADFLEVDLSATSVEELRAHQDLRFKRSMQ